MKIIVKYQCQWCKKDYSDRNQCFAHELKHIGITKEEYEEWMVKQRNVRDTSFKQLDSSNEKTRKSFDNAVEELIKFEEEHNIHGVHLGDTGSFIIDDNK